MNGRLFAIERLFEIRTNREHIAGIVNTLCTRGPPDHSFESPGAATALPRAPTRSMGLLHQAGRLRVFDELADIGEPSCFALRTTIRLMLAPYRPSSTREPGKCSEKASSVGRADTIALARPVRSRSKVGSGVSA
jgi:hypothetical protein